MVDVAYHCHYTELTSSLCPPAEHWNHPRTVCSGRVGRCRRLRVYARWWPCIHIYEHESFTWMLKIRGPCGTPDVLQNERKWAELTTTREVWFYGCKKSHSVSQPVKPMCLSTTILCGMVSNAFPKTTYTASICLLILTSRESEVTWHIIFVIVEHGTRLYGCKNNYITRLL